MSYLGDFVEDATVTCIFTTHDKNGGAIDPSTPFEAADIKWYRDGSAIAPIGIVMSSPFVSTGQHKIVVDTSNDGGDAWIAGADYTAVLDPDETIDSETVIRTILEFSIENRFNEVDLTHIMGTILTEGGASRLAEAFIKLFDVATPLLVASTVMRGTDGVSLVVPPTVAQLNARTILSANYITTASTIAGVTNVGTVTGNVNGLVAGTVAGVTPAAVGAAMALTGAAVDAILDEAVEGAITLRQAQRVLLAYLAGETNGGGTVTINFRDQADTLDRIRMTVDADGDRSATVLDLA